LRTKHIYALLASVLLTGFLSADIFSQIVSMPSRQAAYDAFSKGEYEKAYGEFSLLLQNYPKDPLYKYYSGVCLVKQNREPVNASGLLRDAVNGSLEIKSIPADAWFYLGRSQQMSGKYSDALKSYDHFTDEAGRRAARELNVDGYIAECKAGKGMISDTTEMFGDILKDNPAVTKGVVGQPDKAKPEALTPSVHANPAEKLPEDYDKRLSEAMDYQVKADSLKALASEYRKSYEDLPSDRKAALKSIIVETEKLSAKFQKAADDRFGYPAEAEARDRAKDEAVQRPDTQTAKNEPKAVVSGQVTAGSAEIDGVFSAFDVIQVQPADSSRIVAVDQELPSGLIYRIQIGVYTKPMTLLYFRGITPVFGLRIAGTASVRYYAGLFRRFADASKALLRVKQTGFRDAFLTAASDGKQVSVERAAMLEKEWGLKPFLSVSREPGTISGISVTPTLIFRVEVTRSMIPLGDAVTEEIKKIAGNRSFEIFRGEDRSFVYLIGKFITFESASEYTSLLNRNGYRDARVAGYLGYKEIPVEKAKQLFEKAE
jgi:tetratricopeptide (TPR) repeat protein